MILLHDVIQIFHLAGHDVSAVCLVVAFDRGFIGFAAINRDGLGNPVAADGFLQKPERRLCIPVLRKQKVNGLAVFIHCTVQVAPLAFHADVGFVHTNWLQVYGHKIYGKIQVIIHQLVSG